MQGLRARDKINQHTKNWKLQENSPVFLPSVFINLFGEVILLLGIGERLPVVQAADYPQDETKYQKIG